MDLHGNMSFIFVKTYKQFVLTVESWRKKFHE